ncbi:MAG: twitching motility protein PilT [Nitriliruptorales bacterium]|nr:twitching motility protein PilT [Nitriliruptorales bacterium]
MNLVLDAGALIGIDRDDRRVAGLIELGRRAAADLVTTAPVLGQAWRDDARQARLARALAMIDVRPVVLDDAKDAGVLLGRAGCPDVVDALVALLALPGDQLLTSDTADLSRLVAAREADVRVVGV